MEQPTNPASKTTADFQIADWLVQPNLNRLSREDRTIQLEPKLMDVLVFLAHNAGRVVSKIEITDAVWADVFITESVITRSIAGLRRAFEDDVRNPRFIETISKRGYRLIAEVSAMATTTASHHAAKSTLAAPVPSATAMPFVVGQWVRGEAFYGRDNAINEVLTGNRNWVWLLGTRRVGKTSLLKQLELLAATTPEFGFVPVFWDLQGADRPDELHLDFADALLDAEAHLDGAGIKVTDVQADDCFDSLARLRRELQSRNLRLLLLCDEVEELIQLNRQDPSLLRKLRRALQSREGIRSVLASSSRLWQLADCGEDTSPFLDGFTPPLTLGPLEPDDARDLILQNRLDEASRPRFEKHDVERIRVLCGDHPYLIQILCRRTLDRESLDDAVDDLHNDRAVEFFFAVDFELISNTERDILTHLAGNSPQSPDSLGAEIDIPPSRLRTDLTNLDRLGLARRDPQGRFAVGNDFLRRWLTDRDPGA